jgi:hypothetical protein
MTFQRPLNSSISAMSLRISGVIVMFVISGIGYISIFTHLYPICTQRQPNIHFHPFIPVIIQCVVVAVAIELAEV